MENIRLNSFSLSSVLFMVDIPVKELIVKYNINCSKYTPCLYVISPNTFVLLQLFPFPLPRYQVKSYKMRKVEIHPLRD